MVMSLLTGKKNLISYMCIRMMLPVCTRMMKYNSYGFPDSEQEAVSQNLISVMHVLDGIIRVVKEAEEVIQSV